MKVVLTHAQQPLGMGPGFEDGRQEVAVAVLILAPVLEVLEQGAELVVRVALQVPKKQKTVIPGDSNQTNITDSW